MKKTIIIRFNNLINYCDTMSLCDAYRFVALEIIYRMIKVGTKLPWYQILDLDFKDKK